MSNDLANRKDRTGINRTIVVWLLIVIGILMATQVRLSHGEIVLLPRPKLPPVDLSVLK